MNKPQYANRTKTPSSVVGMTPQPPKLGKLIRAVAKVSPQLADHWQATAIIESLGYTDRIIEKEFGFSDALSLGCYVYEHSQNSLKVKPNFRQTNYLRKIFQELCIFADQFSRSFVYAVPLLVILFLEYLELGHQESLLAPDLASLLTISTMASLCSSGGFVQMISRRGEFYLRLGEPLQAQRVCLPLLYIGFATSIILSFAGLWFGFYRGLFADDYLILATIYYLMLSLLWMLLATLSIQLRWSTPIILLGLSVLFIYLRVDLAMDAIVAQLLAMSVTLAVAIALVTFLFQKNKRETHPQQVKLPHLSALVYLLAPYFFYGVAYFSFIFADRIVAGLAIDPVSGLLFGIDSQYQRGMDLALLNFLLLVPLVEYLSYKLILYWYNQAKLLKLGLTDHFSRQLSHRYHLIIVITTMLFLLSVLLTVGMLKPSSWGRMETIQALVGCLGYLFFVIGLLNAILLFSLNQAIAVIQTLIPSLILNLMLGYLFAHLIGVYSAAIGLLLGAVIFMVLSGRKVFHCIAKPEYVYYLGGY